MNVNVSPRAPGPDERPYASDDVHWLPRSRLRSGGRRGRLVPALIVLTVCVLAAAAGFAAWTRQGEFAQLASADKATERAPAPRAQAPVQTPSSASTVRSVTPGAPASPRPAQAEPRPAPEVRPVQQAQPPAPEPRPATTMRMTAEGQMIPPAPPSAPVAPPPVPVAPPQADIAPPVSLGSAAPSAPAAPPAEPLALGSGVPPSAPPARAAAAAPRAPEPAFAEPPVEASDRAARTAAPASPPQQRVAALPQTAQPPQAPTTPPGGKVAVYLDEYPDQKAAAAGLSQKVGEYGRHIGSAGKLTYSRKLGNEWRLRVSNLDQAEAEELCAKLKGAGAPCAVGPN